MNIHLYIFIISIIFLIITIISFISLLTKYKLKKINDICALIMICLFSTYLYINNQYTGIFLKNTNNTNIFSWTGVILFCYAYLVAFIDRIKYSRINLLILSVLFLIGSCLYILQSIINKNYTLDNHIFSLFDSIFYALSSLYYVFYYFTNNFTHILIGLFLFLIGRLVALCIAYNNLTNKKIIHMHLI